MAFVHPDPPWPVVAGVSYGRDLSCFLRNVSLPMPDGSTFVTVTFDLSTDMAEVDGRQGLAEALARRLVTTRGTLLDDPDYGFDVRQYLNDDLAPRDLALIASGCEQEMLKDERVLRASATATLLNGVLLISISVIDAKGPFKLTLSAADVTIAILVTGT